MKETTKNFVHHQLLLVKKLPHASTAWQ